MLLLVLGSSLSFTVSQIYFLVSSFFPLYLVFELYSTIQLPLLVYPFVFMSPAFGSSSCLPHSVPWHLSLQIVLQSFEVFFGLILLLLYESFTTKIGSDGACLLRVECCFECPVSSQSQSQLSWMLYSVCCCLQLWCCSASRPKHSTLIDINSQSLSWTYWRTSDSLGKSAHLLCCCTVFVLVFKFSQLFTWSTYLLHQLPVGEGAHCSAKGQDLKLVQ